MLRSKYVSQFFFFLTLLVFLFFLHQRTRSEIEAIFFSSSELGLPRPISCKVLLAVRLFKRCYSGGGKKNNQLRPTLMLTEQNSCHSVVSGRPLCRTCSFKSPFLLS